MESDEIVMFAHSEVDIVDEKFDANEQVSNNGQIESTETYGWPCICRVCAKSDDNIIPIFEAEGAEHEMIDKIHKYLPIRVDKTDTLPIQLCYHCAATILAWDELLTGCLDAQKQLLKMQSDQNFIDSTKTKYTENVKNELADNPEPIMIAKQESTSTSQQDEETEHGDLNKGLIKRSNNATETFKLFLANQSLYRNLRRARNEIRDETFDETENTIWREVSCTREENPLINLDSPETGIEDTECQTGEMKITKNERCETKNLLKVEWNERSLRSVNSHSENYHESNLMGTKCTICYEQFTHTDEFENHMREHKNALNTRKTYKCDECLKAFRLKDSLIRHQRIHRDERPFTCHVCGKQFRDSGGLSRHLKDVHAKLKNFTCDICSNSFSSKATRDDHRRTHTGERPYNCENCKKSFKSRACLYIHSKLHTDEFPYPCAHCEKKFRRRQEMLVHVLTHTGEKNYSCDVCSRRFRVKTEVARHKLTHSDEKPYVCAKCGLSFRQNRYLNNHVKLRHSRSSND